MNLLPWGRIKAAFKLKNLLITSDVTVLKNHIEKANTFYKSLVGMDKVEQQRSNMIHLQKDLMKLKENLYGEKSKLKITRHEIQQVQGEVSSIDRTRYYKRFAELSQKENLLKSKEEELLAKLKVKENERDIILNKLDTTKNIILLLERDHATYHKYLTFFFSAVALISSVCYVRDNKKILKRIDEVTTNTKQNEMIGSIEIGSTALTVFLLISLIIIVRSLCS